MATGTITSDGEIIEPYSSILCDGSILNEVIDEFGVPVLIKKTVKYFDPSYEYDTSTDTVTYKRSVAFVNSYSETDDEVKEGLFFAGTIIFNFKTDDGPWLTLNTEILLDGHWWKIADIRPDFSGSNRFMISCVVKKIQ